MIRFCIRSELHFSRHIGIYRSYGLYLYSREKLFLHIPDVFCERRQAQHFITLCNREQPELVHLTELIEDAL